MSNEEAFVNELIGYIFAYPDDDYMTMECLCRKLHKHGLIDKKDGEWTCNFIKQADTPQTALCRECDDYAGDGMYCASNYLVRDFSTSRENCEADTPQTDEIGDCNICRFAGCSECDDCINGSEWVRMVGYLEDVDDE